MTIAAASVSVLAVGTFATSGPTAAAPSPVKVAASAASVSAAASSDDDVANDAAARQLSQDEGISFASALSRVRLQPAISQLNQDLTKNDPDFGGLWIDQAHGGAVVAQTVAHTGDAHIASYAKKYHLTPIVAQRSVRFSLSQLQKTYSDAQTEVATSPKNGASLAADVDIVQNRVEIGTVGGNSKSMTAAQTSWYNGAANRGEPVHRRDTEPGGLTSGCVFPFCNPPSRGGVFLNEGARWGSGYCSTGFNATSFVDGKHYLITAGHCGSEYGGPWTEQLLSDGAFHVVGNTHKAVRGASDDEASIAVNNPAGWHLPSGYVVVNDASSPGYPTTYNDLYSIKTTAFPAIGTYLCRTGATSGTACGPVTSLNAGTAGLNGMIKVHARACQGDSGGPVYVGHAAYGIEVAGSGPAGTMRGPNGGVEQCYSDFYAVNIGRVQAALNMWLDYS
ncbi:S1 family peptidase [Jatrophihabitans sp. DSM 45814]